MKRITLIAITFCLLVLLTAGTGAVPAEPKLPPQYRVVQFNVTYYGEVVGLLTVNTNQWTYVMNAHGLQPGTSYFFYSLGRFPAVGTETANENGDLHMQGTWDPQTADITVSPTFVLTTGPLTGAGCVDPVLTAKSYVMAFKSKVWGNLTTSDGSPLPGQPLEIWDREYDAYDTIFWYRWQETITDDNGGFFVEGPPGLNFHRPKVVYGGGVSGGVTYCSAWVIAPDALIAPLS